MLETSDRGRVYRIGGGYDVVVTVTGSRQTVVTFRKARVLGIWVNADSRVIENAPAYIDVLSNKPLEEVADAETLRRCNRPGLRWPIRKSRFMPATQARGAMISAE